MYFIRSCLQNNSLNIPLTTVDSPLPNQNISTLKMYARVHAWHGFGVYDSNCNTKSLVFRLKIDIYPS